MACSSYHSCDLLARPRQDTSIPRPRGATRAEAVVVTIAVLVAAIIRASPQPSAARNCRAEQGHVLGNAWAPYACVSEIICACVCLQHMHMIFCAPVWALASSSVTAEPAAPCIICCTSRPLLPASKSIVSARIHSASAAMRFNVLVQLHARPVTGFQSTNRSKSPGATPQDAAAPPCFSPATHHAPQYGSHSSSIPTPHSLASTGGCSLRS